mmetsp:Transcript_3398/g.13998  ORF Transcript_3398/g.13998 Transcript_3398/m.13998 type:complete len:213 (+) Transcript_3398:347-985(+)
MSHHGSSSSSHSSSRDHRHPPQLPAEPLAEPTKTALRPCRSRAPATTTAAVMTRPPRRPAVRGCRVGWLPPTPTRLAARPRPLGLAAEPVAAEPAAAGPVAAEAPPAARLGAVTTAESLAALHKASQGLVSSQSREDRAMTTHRRHRLRPVQRRPAQPRARPPPAPAATATPCCCGLFWVSRPTRGHLSWQVMMRWRLAQARPNQLQLQLQL